MSKVYIIKVLLRQDTQQLIANVAETLRFNELDDKSIASDDHGGDVASNKSVNEEEAFKLKNKGVIYRLI